MPTTSRVQSDAGGVPTGGVAVADATRPFVGADRPTLQPGTPAALGPFFALVSRCTPLARALRPLACAMIPLVAPRVREAIRKNGVRIFGRESAAAERRRFTRQVVGSFYDFVVDVARASRMSPRELMGMVETVDGIESYRAARATRRGAILVTAHLGTFEAGLAALVREERHVRVVFKRDPVPEYEQLRARLHHALGVIEAPIDDGMATWLALRDALLNDEVVVMQADRAVPGQRSEVVPFLHGHMRLPTGPIRLAQLTGAPIIPVFALPSDGGGYRVLLRPPIEVGEVSGVGSEVSPTVALREMADAIAGVVAEYPHHWLALEPVFQEDRDDAHG